jgi:DNA-binding MarR family transcriptional regulator
MITEQLSELQQRILKHFFGCTEKTDTVSHISKEINSLQPAVFRSVDSLIKDGYLVKEKRSDGEKIVKLTDKGAATAVLLGIRHDKAEHYLKESKAASGLSLLTDLFKEPNNKDLLLKKGVQFLLDKNWISRTTMEEKDKLQLVAFLLSDSLIREKFDSKDSHIMKFVDTFDLNIRWLLTALQEKQRGIDSLISQLTDRINKQEGLPAPIHPLANSNEDSRKTSFQNKLAAKRREQERQVLVKEDSRNKVSPYGMIESFEGIMDLNNDQLAILREIVNSVHDVDDLKRNKRAADLVKKWSTSEEWEELLTQHQVTIQSKRNKNRTFVVHENPQTKVDVYDNNKLTHKICGVTADSGYADGDQVLNKIIAIKEDEREYIKNSNVYDED